MVYFILDNCIKESKHMTEYPYDGHKIFREGNSRRENKFDIDKTTPGEGSG
jgi:hypothetical protein